MVMSQIKKVESEKKDSDAEDGEGSKKRKNRNEAILGISLRSGQEDRNLVRDAAERTQMLFTVRIVMEKLCH